MCFFHPSTVPQCAVYKSAGVTLSWSSNDWSPSINGTRACGDIDLFWSEQTAPRDFLCHILGLDPDLPLKVEYVQLWLWWSAWVATIIHLAVLMIATRDVSMTCVWLNDYKIGARSIDRLNGTLMRECKMGKRERGDVGKVLNQLLHSHCSSHCEAEVRQYWILNILPYTVCGQSSHSQIGGNNFVWWKHFQKTLNSWTERSEAHLKLFKSELRWKQAAWLPSNKEGG